MVCAYEDADAVQAVGADAADEHGIGQPLCCVPAPVLVDLGHPGGEVEAGGHVSHPCACYPAPRPMAQVQLVSTTWNRKARQADTKTKATASLLGIVLCRMWQLWLASASAASTLTGDSSICLWKPLWTTPL